MIIRIKLSKRYKYTEDDICFLKENYPIGNWDAIRKRFPTVSKSGIYSFCNKNGIKSNFDRKTLTSNLTSRRWSEQEDLILKNNYEMLSIDEMLKLLPGRSKDAITNRASKKYGITSSFRSNQLYSNYEIQYIKDNWRKQSDYQMSKYLNRTQRSVKWMRSELGLLRQEHDRSLTYDDLSKYLRGNIYKWKLDSMESCGYQCVLTKPKDFAIHHLYNFNYILNNFINEYNIVVYDDINKYSNKELEYIVEEFNKFHNKYPLGVCVDKKLHKLFHHYYGKTFNTPEQWSEFQNNFKEGKYNH